MKELVAKINAEIAEFQRGFSGVQALTWASGGISSSALQRQIALLAFA